MTPQEFAVSYFRSKGFDSRYKKHFPDFVKFIKQRNPKVPIILRDVNKINRIKLYLSTIDQYNTFLNTLGYSSKDSPYLVHEFGHAIANAITPFSKKDFSKYSDTYKYNNSIYDFNLNNSGELYSYSYPIFKKNKSYQIYSQKYKNYDNEVAKYYHNGDKNLNGHDADPSESYADLFLLRYDLNESKIFDSRTTNIFTQKHLNQFKKSKYYERNKRLFNNFSDEDIITMMNTVAENNSQKNNQFYYAKKGMKLIPRINTFKFGGKPIIKAQWGSYSKSY